MATVVTDLDFRILSTETNSTDHGTARRIHTTSKSKRYESGSTSNKFNVVWSDTRTVTGSENIDLLSSLNSLLTPSSNANFTSINGIVIINRSTVSGHSLTIGNASNPFAGWSVAGVHTRKVGPGGFMIWWSPVATVAPVAGTGDQIKIDSGSNTVTYEILLIGRSA